MTRIGKPITTRVVGYGRDDKWFADAAYTCDGCGRMSVVTWLTSHDLDDHWLSEYGHDGGPQEYEDARWSPPQGHTRTFPDVRDDIAAVAVEAWTCHTVGAHRGACALARAVVEATAKAKGHTSGNLVAKIDAMASAGLIRQAVADQAHEVRLVGNDVAHGDLGTAVTSEEAEEVLELMGEVLNEVFQAPARRDRLRAQRAAEIADAGTEPAE